MMGSQCVEPAAMMDLCDAVPSSSLFLPSLCQFSMDGKQQSSGKIRCLLLLIKASRNMALPICLQIVCDGFPAYRIEWLGQRPYSPWSFYYLTFYKESF